MRVLGQPGTPTQEANGALPSEVSCLRIVVVRTVRLEEPMPNTWVGIERHFPPDGPQGGLIRLYLLRGLPIVVFGVVPKIRGARCRVVCLLGSVEGDDRPYNVGLEDREQKRPARPGREAQGCQLLPRDGLVGSQIVNRRHEVPFSAHWILPTSLQCLGLLDSGRGNPTVSVRGERDETL